MKARDRDFNEDPTPAMLTFTVLPPVWQEPWFVGLMLGLVGIIGLQAVRIVANNRKLKDVNHALPSVNEGLSETNDALSLERDNL